MIFNVLFNIFSLYLQLIEQGFAQSTTGSLPSPTQGYSCAVTYFSNDSCAAFPSKQTCVTMRCEYDVENGVFAFGNEDNNVVSRYQCADTQCTQNCTLTTQYASACLRSNPYNNTSILYYDSNYLPTSSDCMAIFYKTSDCSGTVIKRIQFEVPNGGCIVYGNTSEIVAYNATTVTTIKCNDTNCQNNCTYQNEPNALCMQVSGGVYMKYACGDDNANTTIDTNSQQQANLISIGSLLDYTIATFVIAFITI